LRELEEEFEQSEVEEGNDSSSAHSDEEEAGDHERMQLKLLGQR